MEYLVWAWRVWLNQIRLSNVPEPIRKRVEIIMKEW